MAKWRLRNFSQIISPYLIAVGVMGFILGTAQNVLSNFLGNVSFWLVLLMLSGPFVLVGFLLPFLVPSDEIRSKIESRTLRTEEEKQRYANRGLIVFVSLYRPMKGTPPAGDKDDKWLQAARGLQYDQLDLENSNLAMAINAVTGHAPRLEHCWLIGTSSNEPAAPGSLNYEPVLIEFLKKEKGLKCEFQSGSEFAIPLDDDALVCQKTYDLVKHIYRVAEKQFGIQRSEMIADFTGCPRSMTLGLLLACLSVDQNVQMMGTRYDGAGRPVGQAFPIIFGYEPLLQSRR